jgi:hypothetical protein
MAAGDTNNLSRMDGWIKDQGSARRPLLWVSHSGDANTTSRHRHHRSSTCVRDASCLTWLAGSPRAGMRSLVIQFNKTAR